MLAPKTAKRDTLDAPERKLIRLLLQGQTVGEAATALRLSPDAGREMLADLLHRHSVSALRQLLTRALVHGWIK